MIYEVPDFRFMSPNVWKLYCRGKVAIYIFDDSAVKKGVYIDLGTFSFFYVMMSAFLMGFCHLVDLLKVFIRSIVGRI